MLTEYEIFDLIKAKKKMHMEINFIFEGHSRIYYDLL